MNSNCLKREKNFSAIDFKNYKLHSLAKEYVRLYAEYGVETASVWSMDKLANDIEIKQFNKFVNKEMCKYGFRDFNEQQ